MGADTRQTRRGADDHVQNRRAAGLCGSWERGPHVLRGRNNQVGVCLGLHVPKTNFHCFGCFFTTFKLSHDK